MDQDIENGLAGQSWLEVSSIVVMHGQGLQSSEGLTKAGASPSMGLTHSSGQLVLALMVRDLPSFPQGLLHRAA